MESGAENLTSKDSVPKEIKHNQEVMEKSLENSSCVVGSTSVSLNSENLNGSNPDLSYQNDENEDNQNDENDASDDNCDASNYGDVDYDYFYDNDDDNYLDMLAQFDNRDLPPGEEASVSWLMDTAPDSNTSIPLEVSGQDGLPRAAPSVPVPLSRKNEAIASSSSTISVDSSSNGKEKVDGDEVVRKCENFKQFDVVDDYSDHHYGNSGFQGQQPSMAWIKKIQNEWKILKNDLPDTIYVRVYESRMDLLRAIIVGPQGTPYHDGLFVFDVLFPPTYPNVPPMVYYYSGGLRLNPNLYDCGKVCLSLLNTWTGKGNEKWLPKSSTMLQVLLSIQALILNAKPFFNEPGHEIRFVGQDGEKKSNSYNEDVFVLSLKTMIYTLRRPPKHFEDLVAGHFRSHAHDILSACRAYMEGALVGSLVNGKVPDGAAPQKGGSSELKASVGRMINGLISNFSRYGVPDCERFRLQI